MVMTNAFMTLLLLPLLTEAQENLANPWCNLQEDLGSCFTFSIKWHYDRYAHRCKQFYYGGCGGNENRFDTYEDCDAQCKFVDNSVYERCAQRYDPGTCHSDISRHYFDMQQGKCICGSWTGCGGNTNKFYSWEHCMGVCGEYASAEEKAKVNKSAVASPPLAPAPNHQSRPAYHNTQQRQIHQTIHIPTNPAQYTQQTMNFNIRNPPTQYTSGQTHIIRHAPDGSSHIVRTINSHPVHVAEKIVEMIRVGKAKDVEDALRQMDETGNYPTHKPELSKNLPNYVYISSRQPLNPVYQNTPRQRVARPMSADERRQYKEQWRQNTERIEYRGEQPLQTTAYPSRTIHTYELTTTRAPFTVTAYNRPTYTTTTYRPPVQQKTYTTTRATTTTPIITTTASIPTTLYTRPPNYESEFNAESLRKQKQANKLKNQIASTSTTVAPTTEPYIIGPDSTPATPSPSVSIPVSSMENHHKIHVGAQKPTAQVIELEQPKEPVDDEYEDEYDDEFEIQQRFDDGTTTTEKPTTTSTTTARPTTTTSTTTPRPPTTTATTTTSTTTTPRPTTPRPTTTTSTTTTTRRPYVPQDEPLHLRPPSTTTPTPIGAKTTRKSLWDDYDSDESDPN